MKHPRLFLVTLFFGIFSASYCSIFAQDYNQDEYNITDPDDRLLPDESTLGIDDNDSAWISPTDPDDWTDYNGTAGVDPTDPGDWIDFNDTAGVDPTDPGDWTDYNDTVGVDPT